jgi:hypothetical protein
MAVGLDWLCSYDRSCGTEREVQQICVREETVQIDHTLMALYLIHISQVKANYHYISPKGAIQHLQSTLVALIPSLDTTVLLKR